MNTRTSAAPAANMTPADDDDVTDIPLDVPDIDSPADEDEELEDQDVDQEQEHDDVPEPDDDEDIEPYDEDKDTRLQAALAMLRQAGMKQGSAAYLAARYGDFEMLGDELRNEPNGKLIIELIKQSREAYLNHRQIVEDRRNLEFERSAGGKKAWNELKTWAEKNASPEEAKDLKEIIGQGGAAGRILVKYLKSIRSGQKQQPDDADKKQPSVKKQKDAEPRLRRDMTTSDINRRIGKLYQKYGEAASQTPEYRALIRRIH